MRTPTGSKGNIGRRGDGGDKANPYLKDPHKNPPSNLRDQPSNGRPLPGVNPTNVPKEFLRKIEGLAMNRKRSSGADLSGWSKMGHQACRCLMRCGYRTDGANHNPKRSYFLGFSWSRKPARDAKALLNTGLGADGGLDPRGGP